MRTAAQHRHGLPGSRKLAVTVAICTRNRGSLLRETLHRIARHAIPPRVELEVIVVDNGSTDDTASVLESCAPLIPLRALTESTPGASYARNRALCEATGEYIVWIDDDVLVCDGWLAAYVEAFERWPDAAFFGGAIEPLFVGAPPPWLLRAASSLEGAFAARDFGGEPLRLTPRLVPFGANLAMRTADQARFGYDVRLGPRPDRAFGGEETDLVRRMLSAGLHGWWVPRARVRHVIPPARQTTAYIRRYYQGYGETLAGPPSSGRKTQSRPLWIWREAVEAELGYRVGRLVSRPEVWVPRLVTASVAWGKLRGMGRRTATHPA